MNIHDTAHGKLKERDNAHTEEALEKNAVLRVTGIAHIHNKQANAPCNAHSPMGVAPSHYFNKGIKHAAAKKNRRKPTRSICA